ncbi:MAG: hypothetical protein HQ453_10380 [Actinobacteria bacterium]|nr:hypothetical protein [Actinomycetota bacterium]
MTTSTKSLLLALVSVVVSPSLVWIELVALLFADMVTYEPENPLWVKVAAVVAVVFIAALALALPVAALVAGKRASSSSASSENVAAGARKALASQVIAIVVIAFVIAAQVYFILMAAGACSLDGC